MDIDKQLHESATMWGADYYGVADLSTAKETIVDQGGSILAEFPRSISVGIALLHAIVDQLPRRDERAVAASYRHHSYSVVNGRLDVIASRLAGILQSNGFKAFPIAASQRTDHDRICGLFSHKLGAHMAGLGWIGKNCLLITPDRGPRVRWATVLTDAPLTPTGRPMGERCEDCQECMEICPVRAIKGQSFRPEESREIRLNASMCDRYLKKMKEKDEETAACGLCLYACPFGRQ